jgi:hypothetical protein
LLACNEAHRAGHPLWVTIPFDPEASGAQPETLARVVRCERADGENGGRDSGGWAVAMHFEEAAHAQSRQDGDLEAGKNRNGSGSKIALPIRVRLENVPWYEEAMTTEVSKDKIKFVTHCEYAFAQRLLVSFAGTEAPWSGDGEWRTQVTGIEMEAGSDSLCVTVRKKSE